jgi:hypothetical protein
MLLTEEPLLLSFPRAWLPRVRNPGFFRTAAPAPSGDAPFLSRFLRCALLGS